MIWRPAVTASEPATDATQRRSTWGQPKLLAMLCGWRADEMPKCRSQRGDRAEARVAGHGLQTPARALQHLLGQGHALAPDPLLGANADLRREVAQKRALAHRRAL